MQSYKSASTHMFERASATKYDINSLFKTQAHAIIAVLPKADITQLCYAVQ